MERHPGDNRAMSICELPYRMAMADLAECDMMLIAAAEGNDYDLVIDLCHEAMALQSSAIAWASRD